MRTACLLLLLAAPLYGEDTCSTPDAASGQAWPKGQAVSVNISSDFSGAQIEAIKLAFENWESAEGLRADVGFGFSVGNTISVGPGLNGPPGSFQINRRTPGGNLGAAGETGGFGTGEHRRNAFTNIDPRVTSPSALLQTMAHEIGHTFGLGECGGCPPGSSVMNGFERGNYNDDTSGANGPTPCDVSQANASGHYGRPFGWTDIPGSGADGKNCRACSIPICQGRGETRECHDKKGYCCPKGFIAEEDWDSTPTCGFINFWGPEQFDECQNTCNDECRKKSNCGDAPCMPLGYCWKCPEVDMGDAGDSGPPGRTCEEMGWYPADKLSECEAANGSCGRKQWCDYGMCQPWPNYCWKAN